MAIVYYRNSKTGKTYAYETESHYSKEKGYSIPKRKYLGRVDENNQIIPSTGKPGRPKKSPSGDGEQAVNVTESTEYLALQKQHQELMGKYTQLLSAMQELKARNNELSNALARMKQILDAVGNC